MTNKEAIDRLNGMQSRCENGWDAEAIFLAIKALEEQPTVKWDRDCDGFTCSHCNMNYPNIDTVMGKPMWEYCPNCGARMLSANK